jgi:hypothetical protein
MMVVGVDCDLVVTPGAWNLVDIPVYPPDSHILPPTVNHLETLEVEVDAKF